jgi:hypothetical protein
MFGGDDSTNSRRQFSSSSSSSFSSSNSQPDYDYEDEDEQQDEGDSVGLPEGFLLPFAGRGSR